MRLFVTLFAIFTVFSSAEASNDVTVGQLKDILECGKEVGVALRETGADYHPGPVFAVCNYPLGAYQQWLVEQGRDMNNAASIAVGVAVGASYGAYYAK